MLARRRARSRTLVVRAEGAGRGGARRRTLEHKNEKGDATTKEAAASKSGIGEGDHIQAKAGQIGLGRGGGIG